MSLNALDRFRASILNLLQNAPEPDLEKKEEKMDTTLAVDESANLTGETIVPFVTIVIVFWNTCLCYFCIV